MFIKFYIHTITMREIFHVYVYLMDAYTKPTLIIDFIKYGEIALITSP